MIFVKKFLLLFVVLLFAGCAGIEKRDTVDHSASETPIRLASCTSTYPIEFERVSLGEFVQYGGAMLAANQPTLDVLAKAALSDSGCGTTSGTAWYRVSTSFDVTGKMLGSNCGAQIGGIYGIVLGSYGGRCVNFNSARVTFTVTDMKTGKMLLVSTAETGTSADEENAGGRFLKGLRESGVNDGGFSKTPEGRIIAGLMKNGLEAMLRQMNSSGLAAVDNKSDPSPVSTIAKEVPPAPVTRASKPRTKGGKSYEKYRSTYR